MIESPEYLTLEALAQFLGVHSSTVRRWIKAGELRATRIGGWRIAVADVNAFINGRTTEAKRESEVPCE